MWRFRLVYAAICAFIPLILWTLGAWAVGIPFLVYGWAYIAFAWLVTFGTVLGALIASDRWRGV
jgi:hypothetical protein